MSNLDLSDKARAHALQYEWIVDVDGDVCLREMHFDEEGRRVVRHQPDPGEFIPFRDAHVRLRALEAEAGFDVEQVD